MKMLLLGLALALPSMAGLHAAELRVLAGGSLTGVLNELGPQFERTTGHKLTIHFNSTPNLIKATASEPFDLGVVPIDLFKDAAAKARFVAGPTVDIARAGYGVAVRAGAPKPDVSTPDALKKTLLDAQSIAFVPQSAAGAYVSSVFARLGIEEAMKAKTRVQAGPPQIAPAVASGEAELGVFLTNVLIAPGVELAGSFPAELQQELVFTAAVAAETKDEDAREGVHCFSDYSRRRYEVIKAKGMNPG